jgi:hypothetical protein
LVLVEWRWCMFMVIPSPHTHTQKNSKNITSIFCVKFCPKQKIHKNSKFPPPWWSHPLQLFNSS